MDIKEFLAPADALIDVRISDKARLLQELAQRTATALDLPVDRISSALLKREVLGSTGTGGGIAIPHTRITELKKGILVRLEQPIDFDAIDDQPIDLLFLLLLPITSDKEQLDALASVARILRNSRSARNLRRARDSASLFRAMS
jgi:PTS system nitrogen regulatory IIA component